MRNAAVGTGHHPQPSVSIHSISAHLNSSHFPMHDQDFSDTDTPNIRTEILKSLSLSRLIPYHTNTHTNMYWEMGMSLNNQIGPRRIEKH